jgi:hypothetical protein
MKAIINGFRYDTEKAELIGEASRGENTRDFESWEAGLYVTKTARRYFLAGSGGPMTQYARSRGGNETSGGERIDPMDKEEALAWAEQYLDADEIEAGFTEDIQDA